MHGSDFGSFLGVVSPQATIAKAFVEGTLHELLVGNTTTGVVEEIFVEDDARVLVPPRGVKDDIDG